MPYVAQMLPYVAQIMLPHVAPCCLKRHSRQIVLVQRGRPLEHRHQLQSFFQRESSVHVSSVPANTHAVNITTKNTRENPFYVCLLSAQFYLRSFICTVLSAQFYLRSFICAVLSAQFYLHSFICTVLSAQFYLRSFICTVLSAQFYLHSYRILNNSMLIVRDDLPTHVSDRPSGYTEPVRWRTGTSCSRRTTKSSRRTRTDAGSGVWGALGLRRKKVFQYGGGGGTSTN